MALLVRSRCALVGSHSLRSAAASSAVHVLQHARSSASQSYGLHTAQSSRQTTTLPLWRPSYSLKAPTAALQICRAQHTLAAPKGHSEHKVWQPPNRPWTTPDRDSIICGASRASVLEENPADVDWQLKQLQCLSKTSNHSSVESSKAVCRSYPFIVVAPGRKACNARWTTADKPPGGGSWIGWWEMITGRKRGATKCVVAGCDNAVWCGAHLMVDSDPDGMQVKLPMIGPMCRTHNHYLKYPAHHPHELRVGAILIAISLHKAWDAGAFMPAEAVRHAGVRETAFAITNQSDSTAWDVEAFRLADGVSYPGVRRTAVAITSAGDGTDRAAIDTAELQGCLAERLSEGPGVFEEAGLQPVWPVFENDEKRYDLFVQYLLTPRG